MQLDYRMAVSTDAEAIMTLITELAVYEKEPNAVTLTAQQLIADGLGENTAFQVMLAHEKQDVVGMAFFYPRYSTWKGKTLYLEDLIVKESWRGKGIGNELFDRLVIIAQEQGMKRLEWQVLDWNVPAIDFYRKKGSIIDEEWLNCKLEF